MLLREDLALAAAAIFFRVSAVALLMPGFGSQLIPARIRLMVALAFTAFVVPLIDLPGTAQTGVLGILRLLATETIVGVLIGLLLRLFELALQTAGAIAAQTTSLAQLFGGAKLDPMPAIGTLIALGGITLALSMGVHLHVITLLVRSYDLFPLGQFPEAGVFAELGIAQIGATFALSFQLAAPFVVLSLLYNLVMGVINRAMPQLMVAFVGAPAITAVSMGLLFLLMPLLLSVWWQSFELFLGWGGSQ